jgi:predicted aconitase with swiveling domain
LKSRPQIGLDNRSVDLTYVSLSPYAHKVCLCDECSVTDTILCIPQSIGSSSAATLFMVILERNLAPKAMLFANHIDSLAACGLLMGDTWLEKRIVTVDMLGSDFLDAVKTGRRFACRKTGWWRLTIKM